MLLGEGQTGTLNQLGVGRGYRLPGVHWVRQLDRCVTYHQPPGLSGPARKPLGGKFRLA